MDPAAQDVDQISIPPGPAQTATIAPPYRPWDGSADHPRFGRRLRLAQPATTQAVRLVWDRGAGRRGLPRLPQHLPGQSRSALGSAAAETFTADETSFEDRLDLEPRTYWYTVVALNRFSDVLPARQTLEVPVQRGDHGGRSPGPRPRSPPATILRWVVRSPSPCHPLGTDYLGRDMLARLMYGARVSLFIGIVAPLLYVLFGIVYGSVAGFLGGRVDQLLMRFADFVVALPFLLFMILFKIAFGIGPGESGIMPMMVAWCCCGWPAHRAARARPDSADSRGRLHRVPRACSARRTGYLVLRHMIPNTLGVILVTLTFAVPNAIFTEAFLSFIGMGVAPPTPSWGSMCNEGIKTMLTHPHELILPALFISIAVLAFNLLGDGLRDALDVRK